MTRTEEAAFEKKAEKHFRTHHRDSVPGRAFTCFKSKEYFDNSDKYKQNFDRIFPNSPGVGF